MDWIVFIVSALVVLMVCGHFDRPRNYSMRLNAWLDTFPRSGGNIWLYAVIATAVYLVTTSL
jgi:hypothetical protein